MRPLSRTVPFRARQVVAAAVVVAAAAVVAAATGCGAGLSPGRASAAGHGHPAAAGRPATGRPATVSPGRAADRRRAAPPRVILPCRLAGGTRPVAATVCRALPHAPLPSPALGRIMCPMAVAHPGHRARVVLWRPGCRLLCPVKPGALARCGPIWGCWNAGLQASPGLLCAEGARSPQDMTPGQAAAAGRPATGG